MRCILQVGYFHLDMHTSNRHASAQDLSLIQQGMEETEERLTDEEKEDLFRRQRRKKDKYQSVSPSVCASLRAWVHSAARSVQHGQCTWSGVEMLARLPEVSCRALAGKACS